MPSQRKEADALILGNSFSLRTQFLRHPELHARGMHRAAGQGIAARDQVAATDLGQRLFGNLLSELVGEPAAIPAGLEPMRVARPSVRRRGGVIFIGLVGRVGLEPTTQGL